MLKNIISLGLLTLCTGCATQSNNKSIKFGWWGGAERQEATQKAIQFYENNHPETKISGESLQWQPYIDKYFSQISSNNDLDISQIHKAWLPSYSQDGNGYYDLNLSGKIDKSEFDPNVLSSGIVNGKLNAIPVTYTSRIFLWNYSTWHKAGLLPPKTWNQLLASGETFKEKLGNDYYPMDCKLYDKILISHAYIFQKTGKQWIDPTSNKVALNNEQIHEWIDFFKQLESRHVCPKQEYREKGSASSLDETFLNMYWAKGNFAGAYAWDSQILQFMSTPSRDMRIDVGDFLSQTDAINSGRFGRPALMLVVSKNSKNKEKSAEFINWLSTSKDAASILKGSRGVPVSKTQYEYLVQNNVFSKVEINAAKQIRSEKIDPPSALIEHTMLQNFMIKTFKDIESGKISDETATKILTDDATKIILRLR